MAERFNSAQRIYNIIHKARQHDGNTQAMEVWTRVFEVPPDHGVEQQYRIMELLSVLRREIRLCESLMTATRIKPDTYRSVFLSLDESTNLAYVVAQWHNTAKFYTDANMSSLSIFSDILDDDGVPISHEELVDLISELEDVRDSVLISDLPEDAKRFLLNQIYILLSALRAYPIAGNKVFQDALGDLISSSTRDKKAYQDSADNEQFQTVLQRVQKVWSFCMTRAGEATTIAQLVEWGVKLLGG
jgi:hypothetical protein